MTDNTTARERLPNPRLCENVTFEHPPLRQLQDAEGGGGPMTERHRLPNRQQSAPAMTAAEMIERAATTSITSSTCKPAS